MHFTYISRYFVNCVSLSYRNWKSYIEASLFAVGDVLTAVLHQNGDDSLLSVEYVCWIWVGGALRRRYLKHHSAASAHLLELRTTTVLPLMTSIFVDTNSASIISRLVETRKRCFVYPLKGNGKVFAIHSKVVAKRAENKLFSTMVDRFVATLWVMCTDSSNRAVTIFWVSGHLNLIA